jgi:hypothetical protein
MENQEQTNSNETELITALRDEYEKKLAEQRAELEQKHEEEIKKQEQKHIEQMKALLLGRAEKQEVAKPQEEHKTFEQDLYDKLAKKFKL